MAKRDSRDMDQVSFNSSNVIPFVEMVVALVKINKAFGCRLGEDEFLYIFKEASKHPERYSPTTIVPTIEGYRRRHPQTKKT